jgi:hypothetical protein
MTYGWAHKSLPKSYAEVAVFLGVKEVGCRQSRQLISQNKIAAKKIGCVGEVWTIDQRKQASCFQR